MWLAATVVSLSSSKRAATPCASSRLWAMHQMYSICCGAFRTRCVEWPCCDHHVSTSCVTLSAFEFSLAAVSQQRAEPPTHPPVLPENLSAWATDGNVWAGSCANLVNWLKRIIWTDGILPLLWKMWTQRWIQQLLSGIKEISIYCDTLYVL